MGKILMCGSFKGGVGKTASSWNLAYSLAGRGKKVLAVDFDSQANLTTCFGVEDPAAVAVTIGHLMMNRLEDEEMPDPSEFIRSRNGVDFIPSSMMLSAVDSKLRMEMGSERMLAGILESLRGLYDYIIVDTCPSLGTLTINALTAADEVIIAVNPQLLAMVAAVDLSYLNVKMQKLIQQVAEAEGKKLKPKQAGELRKMGKEITKETIECVLAGKEQKKPQSVSVKLPLELYERYFGQMDAGAVQEIMEKALEGYFGKEAPGV